METSFSSLENIENELRKQYKDDISNQELVSFVFDALRALPGISFVEKDMGEGVSGRFDASRSTVFYNTNYIQDNTLLHESIHAVTCYYLKAEDQTGFPKDVNIAIAELNECYRLLKDDFIKSRFYENGRLKDGVNLELAFDFHVNSEQSLYGLRSPAEMVAELSNPDFIRLVRDFDKRHSGGSLWLRLTDAVFYLFHIKKEYRSLESTLKKAFVTLLMNPSPELYRRYSIENLTIKNNVKKFKQADHKIYFQNKKIIDGIIDSIPDDFDGQYYDSVITLSKEQARYCISLNGWGDGKIKISSIPVGTLFVPYHESIHACLRGRIRVEGDVVTIPIRLYNSKSLSLNEFFVQRQDNGFDVVQSIFPSNAMLFSQAKGFGATYPYHNNAKASNAEMAIILSKIKKKKYTFAGTDLVSVESENGTRVFLIDHSSDSELYENLRAGGDGFGIRQAYNRNEITQNDVKEIIRNVASEYGYFEERICEVLQDIGVGPGHLRGVDIAAEIMRIFDDNALGFSGNRETQFNRTNSGHDDLDSEHRRVGPTEGAAGVSNITVHNSVPNLVSGRIVDVKFSNAQGWKLLSFVGDDGRKFSLTGVLPDVKSGERLIAEGLWSDYKGAPQFNVKGNCFIPGERYTDTLIKYLSAGAFPGIGRATAAFLVRKYGIEALQVVSSTPEVLLGMNKYFSRHSEGLPQRLERIREAFAEVRQSMVPTLWLMQYGVSYNAAQSIYKSLGSKTISTMTKNPYWCVNVQGFGFLKADAIAASLGIDKLHPQRIAAGVDYALSLAEQREGCTCLPWGTLVSKSREVLGFGDESDSRIINSINATLADANNASLVESDSMIYHKWLFENESRVASCLTSLIQAETAGVKVPDGFFKEMEALNGFPYSEKQQEAIVMAASNNVSIITGVPGGGKTTIINGMLSLLRKNGYSDKDFVLAAPTGKASKRMTEQTSHEASTIHRLLVYNPQTKTFIHNEDNPIEGKVVFIDETSMIDVSLMSSLLGAVSPGTKLVLLGDPEQLPSIGPGNVLRDMIGSGKIPVTRLSEIYRQGHNSDVITVSKDIREGRIPGLDKYTLTDVSGAGESTHEINYIPVVEEFDEENRRTAAKIHDTVVKLVSEILPAAGVKLDDIQVLCPGKQEWDGSSSLNVNLTLQQLFNPDGETLQMTREREYHVGDKVLLTKNMASEDVYNGDQGYIVSCDQNKRTFTVDFDGREVVFDKESSENILLGYAMTIHKSQGSEYPYVVIPLHLGNSGLLTRNLLYTAITRGKKVFLVGDRRAIEFSVKNVSKYGRTSGLSKQIENKCVTRENRQNILAENRVFETLVNLPADYLKQIELTGRINGTVSTKDGTDVVVQVVNDEIMFMRPSEIEKYISENIENESISIYNLKDIFININENAFRELCSGRGCDIRDMSGKKRHVVFDFSSRQIIETKPFSIIKREHCLSKNKQNADKELAIGRKKPMEKSILHKK